MATIQEIIEKAKEFMPKLDEARVMQAYEFAENAHRGQTRFSGEPYIIHPLSVANILMDFHPDEDTLIAALLHDVAEDTEKGLKEIEMHFGSNVSNLCWGMEKLSKVRSKLNDPQTENLRKLFLAMAKDFRVVLLKLCDRLHNMETLDHVRPDKQTRIAQETLNIYAPIAARLGIYRLKSQLEDYCFKYLLPAEYKNINDQLSKTGKGREKYIEDVKKALFEIFAREGIHARIEGRVKSLYSIYRKLRKKNRTSIDDIFDVFAMRILLPDIYKHDKEYTGHIYTALGVLHNNFTPLANRFKDYVAVPKVNGYRSLHTTVMGLGSKLYTQPTEVQIRTESMHQAAEFGIAAHWLYEEHVSDFAENKAVQNTEEFMKKHRDWIFGLYKIEEETENNQELLENLKVDIFQDRIFVLTPRGDVKDLPVGATPVDFAYAVHTEVGNHCFGVRVNGTIVSLDKELKSGEVVEIMTRKNARPSHHWLSFVKTNHAKNCVRSWFRDLDVVNNSRDGKALLNKKLKQLGKPILDDSLSLLKNYGDMKLTTKEREDLLVEIGRGSLLVSTVVRKIFLIEDLLQSRSLREARSLRTMAQTEEERNKPSPKLFIGGEENMPFHFVKCCNASLGDELVGYTTRGRGISVHKKNCLVMRNSDPSRIVVVDTVKKADGKASYAVHIKILMDDRIGLIKDISDTISSNSINIMSISLEQLKRGQVSIDLVLEIQGLDQLERVLSSIEKIPNVRRAVKVS